jgi:hypothetical protein
MLRTVITWGALLLCSLSATSNGDLEIGIGAASALFVYENLVVA